MFHVYLYFTQHLAEWLTYWSCQKISGEGMIYWYSRVFSATSPLYKGICSQSCLMGDPNRNQFTSVIRDCSGLYLTQMYLSENMLFKA